MNVNLDEDFNFDKLNEVSSAYSIFMALNRQQQNT